MPLHIRWRLRRIRQILLNRFFLFLDRASLLLSYPYKAAQAPQAQIRPLQTGLYQCFGDKRPAFLEYKVPEKLDLQAFVSELPNAELVGTVVIAPNGRIVLESCIFQPEYFQKTGLEWQIFTRRWRKSAYLDTDVLPLGNYLSTNYFHWTTETLPRMLAVEELGYSDYTVLLTADAPKVCIEMLELLFGIPPARILANSHPHLCAKRVLVSSFVHARPADAPYNLYAASILEKIKTKALQKVDWKGSKFSRRFIISRKGAGQRQILNETALQAHLGIENLQILSLDGLNFSEQVQLFANAELIIAVHGAALTNLLYAQTAKVVELYPSNRSTSMNDAYCYQQISQLNCLSHIFYRVPCTDPNEHLFLSPTDLDFIKQQLLPNEA